MVANKQAGVSRRALLAASAAGLGLLSLPAWAQLDIEITGVGSQLFPISLFPCFHLFSLYQAHFSVSHNSFLPHQQLYQHAPDRQHQCSAGTRHNLCKWKQFHPFRTAEHRHISGTAHVRRTHPRCDR